MLFAFHFLSYMTTGTETLMWQTQHVVFRWKLKWDIHRTIKKSNHTTEVWTEANHIFANICEVYMNLFLEGLFPKCIWLWGLYFVWWVINASQHCSWQNTFDLHVAILINRSHLKGFTLVSVAPLWDIYHYKTSTRWKKKKQPLIALIGSTTKVGLTYHSWVCPY